MDASSHSLASHFVIYFSSDRSLQVMKKNQITFTEKVDEVFAKFPTRTLLDDGREEIVDESYSGFVIFSGSATSTRKFQQSCHDEIDFKSSSEGELLESLKKLANERRGAGKRGACSKLNRLLAEEQGQEKKQKKTDDAELKVAGKRKVTKMPEDKPTQPTKTKMLTIIKLNEMKAFSNVSSKLDTVKENSRPTTPTLQETTPTCTPDTRPNKKKTGTPKKVNDPVITPHKTTTLNPRRTSPRKKTPNKETTGTDSKANNPPITPRKKKVTTPIQTDAPQQTSTPLKSTHVQLDFERTVGSLPDLPSAVLTGLNTVNDSCHEYSGYGFNTALASYSESQSNSLIYEDLAGSPSVNCGTGMDFMNWQSPENTASSSGIGQRPSTTRRSCDVGQPSNRNTTNLNDFFMTLDASQKWAVTGFLERLLLQFREMGSGGSNDQQSVSSQHTYIPHTGHDQSKESFGTTERKIPLIVDPDQEDHFSTVLVNPAKIRAAESRALTAKNPGAHLLNKTVDLVFSAEELRVSKGVSSLDPTKIEAIQDYLFAKCKELKVDQVPKKKFMTILQNKIGNLRANSKISGKKID